MNHEQEQQQQQQEKKGLKRKRSALHSVTKPSFAYENSRAERIPSVLLQRLASGEVSGSPIRAACAFFVPKSEVEEDYCRKVQLFIITAPLAAHFIKLLIIPPSEEAEPPFLSGEQHPAP